MVPIKFEYSKNILWVAWAGCISKVLQKREKGTEDKKKNAMKKFKIFLQDVDAF